MSTFIHEMLSGHDGSISSTRFCIVSTFLFIIGVGAGLFFKIGTPLTINDYCLFMTGAASFLVTVTAPLYLINQGAGIATAKFACTAANPPQTPAA